MNKKKYILTNMFNVGFNFKKILFYIMFFFFFLRLPIGLIFFLKLLPLYYFNERHFRIIILLLLNRISLLFYARLISFFSISVYNPIVFGVNYSVKKKNTINFYIFLIVGYVF